MVAIIHGRLDKQQRFPSIHLPVGVARLEAASTRLVCRHFTGLVSTARIWPGADSALADQLFQAGKSPHTDFRGRVM